MADLLGVRHGRGQQVQEVALARLGDTADTGRDHDGGNAQPHLYGWRDGGLPSMTNRSVLWSKLTYQGLVDTHDDERAIDREVEVREVRRIRHPVRQQL